MTVWLPYPYRAGFFDDLDVTVEICPSPSEMPSDPANVDFFVPPFLYEGRISDVTRQMPNLQVIQLLSAGADAWVGRVPDHVALCDARGVHTAPTSEWVLTAILAYLRQFPRLAVAQSQGHWVSRAELGLTEELTDKRVLIIGAGAIGDAIARRVAACDATVTKVARSARDGVHAVSELPYLLPDADVVVLITPLTDETRGMVGAEFLSRMHDGALLVNAARGPVVVTDAMVKEAVSGRLGFALDVTDPEPLPVGHPLWSMPNVLITPHTAGAVQGLMKRAYGLVHDQIRRHISGEPLINVVVGGY